MYTTGSPRTLLTLILTWCTMLHTSPDYTQQPITTKKDQRALKWKGLIALGASFYYLKIAAKNSEKLITNAIKRMLSANVQGTETLKQMSLSLAIKQIMIITALLYASKTMGIYGLEKLEEDAILEKEANGAPEAKEVNAERTEFDK